MNLVIVEDEPKLRNNLANNIPWEVHGIEIAGLYEDGLVALDLIERKKPDLLLIDIEIPGMNGLELARTVLRDAASLKIVILSGHDDFAYAQTAIELGISSYLLKPAGGADILQAVAAAADELRREREDKYNQISLKRKWDENMPHLQETFLQHWIGGRYDAWEVERRSGELQLAICSSGRFAVMAMEIDPLLADQPDRPSRFSSKDTALLQFSLLCIAREYMAETVSGWVVNDEAGRTVCILPAEADEIEAIFMQRVQATAIKIVSLVHDCLKVTVSAGIGTICSGEQIRASYQQSVQALHERVVHGPDIVIPYRQNEIRASVFSVSSRPEQALQRALDQGDEVAAATAVGELYDATVGKAEHAEQASEYVLYVHSLMVRVIHAKGWSVREVTGVDYEYFRHPDRLIGKEQIAAWLQRLVATIFRYASAQRSSSSNELVRTMIDYVQENLHQDVSLYAASEKLYANSSYLSRLFKQEIGKSFSTYVTEVKMERARELLANGAKVYDAAKLLGYGDVSYFTKIFRKFWGVTPGEIKRQ
ncbi:response regulator [Paenibacillus sp. MBLB4367]|uniref:response regulator n=1 Tax=Paenibacillus sp. MBLB4367 TaxID=3384767 RepID=UPI0039080877